MLVETEALKNIGANPLQRPLRACRHPKYDSDPYWECVVRHSTLTVSHGSSTCKMGAADDPKAVVDPQLR